ncbi:HIRAN domain-containing protein [Actinosynnema sp. CA-248983]
MDGYGIFVDFDGQRLVVRPKTVQAQAALGTTDLHLAPADIAFLNLKTAGLLRNGRLELTMHNGSRYQLPFTRPQEADFTWLYGALMAARAGMAGVAAPQPYAMPVPPQPHTMPVAAPQPPTAPITAPQPPTAPITAPQPPTAPITAPQPPTAPITAPQPPTAPITAPQPPAAPQPACEVVAPEVLVLRGSGWFGQEVVGESHYTEALSGLAGKTRTGERETLAELRPEPHNSYDRNAVQVVVEGQVVGYLPREAAAEYHQPLKAIGRPAACRARLWWSRERGDLMASVTLDLADVALLFPVNSVDTGVRHVVVPPGRTYQLAKENEHLDVLGPLVQQGHVPGRALVVAGLRVVERVGPRSTSQVVEVLVDGRLIGELSKQTSTRLAPFLRPLQEAGVACYADVALTGNAFAVEARLHITPPEELPPDFVAQVQRELAGADHPDAAFLILRHPPARLLAMMWRSSSARAGALIGSSR